MAPAGTFTVNVTDPRNGLPIPQCIVAFTGFTLNDLVAVYTGTNGAAVGTAVVNVPFSTNNLSVTFTQYAEYEPFVMDLGAMDTAGTINVQLIPKEQSLSPLIPLIVGGVIGYVVKK